MRVVNGLQVTAKPAASGCRNLLAVVGSFRINNPERIFGGAVRGATFRTLANRRTPLLASMPLYVSFAILETSQSLWAYKGKVPAARSLFLSLVLITIVYDPFYSLWGLEVNHWARPQRWVISNVAIIGK